MQTLRLVLGIIYKPLSSLKEIKEKKPLISGLILLLALWLIGIVFTVVMWKTGRFEKMMETYMAAKGFTYQPIARPFGENFYIMSSIISTPAYLLVWMGILGLVHLAARILNGAGTFKGLATVFVYILCALWIAGFILTYPSMLLAKGLSILMWWSYLLLLWMLALEVMAIKVVYNLGVWWSILLAIGANAILFVIFGAVGFIFALTLFS